jgi:hypothetical protein
VLLEEDAAAEKQAAGTQINKVIRALGCPGIEQHVSSGYVSGTYLYAAFCAQLALPVTIPKRSRQPNKLRFVKKERS